MIYVAAVYGNLGNYKSFGDTKFVPALTAAQFKLLLTAGKAPAATVDELWAECCERMYSLPPRQRQMGLGKAQGVSTYFSANCDEADAALAAKFLESLALSPYNTRLFKTGAASYTVRIASAVAGASASHAGAGATGARATGAGRRSGTPKMGEAASSSVRPVSARSCTSKSALISPR
mgnify:CR=1 FL=1